jgi:dipeptidyl aminopeptidase/acylaminoacyl peptidase
MKRFLLVISVIILPLYIFAQKMPLDSAIYNQWRTIGSFLVSDDANVVVADYISHNRKHLLNISVREKNVRKEFPDMERARFAANQKMVAMDKGDTLLLFNTINFKLDTIYGLSKVSSRDDSRYLACTDKNEKLVFVDVESAGCINTNIDTKSINKHQFLKQNSFLLLQKDSAGNGRRAFFSFLKMNNDGTFSNSVIHESNRYINDFSLDGESREVIFFTSEDSTGLTDVRAEKLVWNKRDYKNEANGFAHQITKLNQTMLQDSMVFNFKKGISFSEKNDYYKFEITKSNHLVKKGKKEKVSKPKFEFELWRWNDTLLPTQKKRRNVFAESLKCIYRPNTGKLIQLSRGKGVYLMVDDNAPFSVEIDGSDYLMDDMWKDPLPKDLYYTNATSGEHKQILKGYEGSFFISSATPYIFLYDFSDQNWHAFNPEDSSKVNLSSGMTYPVAQQDFDKPQPAGSYGKAGITKDLRYLLVYDQYDIWALPIDGDSSKIFCLTNEYGRKNNIKFRLLNLSGKKPASDLVDIGGELLLESVNMENMHTGFFKLTKGKKLVSMNEGACKYTYVKSLDNGKHILKIESFSQAPDYWLADSGFMPYERLTNLNDQLEGYKTGESKVINWDDGSSKNTGILYTPEGYELGKSYPTIVYFYETMSQDVFHFYNPEPTTSTINPLMFVSRGYVVFMPDIKYEIGRPGESCKNIVVSGTEYLIDKKIADPAKIGIQGHSWGGYQVAYVITQTNMFKCACTETAVANMTSAYSGLRAGPGKTRMFMYESTQSRIGGSLWEKKENYIENSPVFYLDKVTTPLLSRHSDGDEAVPFTQGLELFLGLKRLGKPVWMFNYKGDGHNIKKREIAEDWTRRMDQFFDYYLLDKEKPNWM